MMRKLELTLAIIKPHTIKNPVAVSYIRNVIKNRFIVLKTKRTTLDSKSAGAFYSEHIGKFFYHRLVSFMSSGAVDVHVLSAQDAVRAWRGALGPSGVYRAQLQQPHCLRALFGLSDTRNVAHGSDSPHAAEREIKFFFPEFSFYNWHDHEEAIYRNGPIVFNDFLFQHVRKLYNYLELDFNCINTSHSEYCNTQFELKADAYNALERSSPGQGLLSVPTFTSLQTSQGNLDTILYE